MISISDVGVVIQGPILSRGRTMDDLQPRDYDASVNVNKLFAKASEAGAGVVVVTWEGEDVSNLDPVALNNTLIVEMPKQKWGFRARNNFVGNNKYKQFYSTLKGAESLSQRGYKYVLKIRTDQEFPLEVFFQHVSRMSDFEVETRIFTPLLNLDKPNMFYDFYYFSRTTTMLEFNQTLLSTKELCSNVHFDVFYRWITRHEKIRIRDLPLIYPRQPHYTIKQINFIISGWSKDFGVLPKDCWRGISWRGEPFLVSAVKQSFVFTESFSDEIKSQIAERKNSDRSRIDFTAIMSFWISSKLEDKLRVLRINLVRLVNKVKHLVRRRRFLSNKDKIE
jgi:hypothetical protein